MFTLLFGIFALFWTSVFAVVGIGLFLGLLIPFLILALVIRIGFLLVKLAAGVVLLALFAVCLF